MTDELHFPDLPPEAIIQIGEVQLAIEQIIRELDDAVEFDDPNDRAIVIHLLSMSYIEGWVDRHNGKTLDNPS